MASDQQLWRAAGYRGPERAGYARSMCESARTAVVQWAVCCAPSARPSEQQLQLPPTAPGLKQALAGLCGELGAAAAAAGWDRRAAAAAGPWHLQQPGQAVHGVWQGRGLLRAGAGGRGRQGKRLHCSGSCSRHFMLGSVCAKQAERAAGTVVWQNFLKQARAVLQQAA